MTAEQICKTCNITHRNFMYRVHLLALKGTGRPKVYNKGQIARIIACEPVEKNMDTHPRNLKAVEIYEVTGNARNVARTLKMQDKHVHAAIRQVRETGELIVASKMNKPVFTLEEQLGEYYLYDDHQNLVGSTENMKDYFLLNKVSIARHLKMWVKRQVYRVQVFTDDSGMPVPLKRVLTVLSISPS